MDKNKKVIDIEQKIAKKQDQEEELTTLICMTHLVGSSSVRLRLKVFDQCLHM